MNKIAIALAPLLFGFGCSHSPPKPETHALAAASTPRKAPPPVTHTSTSTQSQTSNHDDSAGNAIYFDFDSATLRQDARPILQQVGKLLTHGSKSIRIEGNCDDRGTTEYNLALGDRRARQAKDYLVHLGVSGKQISVISYGSERPKASGEDERAWAQNRRDDLVLR
jgi:peptidoglycan-associated lipoprotein